MSRPELETKKIGSVYHMLGMVADPAPDILLNKELLARLKVQMLDHEIVELKNGIKFAESYKALLKEQYKIT